MQELVRELGRDVAARGGPVVLTFVALAAVGYLLLARRPGAAALIAVSVVGVSISSRLSDPTWRARLENRSRQSGHQNDMLRIRLDSRATSLYFVPQS